MKKTLPCFLWAIQPTEILIEDLPSAISGGRREAFSESNRDLMDPDAV